MSSRETVDRIPGQMRIDIEREAVLHLASDKPFADALADLRASCPDIEIVEVNETEGWVKILQATEPASITVGDLVVIPVDKQLGPGESERLSVSLGNEEPDRVVLIREVIIRGVYI